MILAKFLKDYQIVTVIVSVIVTIAVTKIANGFGLLTGTVTGIALTKMTETVLGGLTVRVYDSQEGFQEHPGNPDRESRARCKFPKLERLVGGACIQSLGWVNNDKNQGVNSFVIQEGIQPSGDGNGVEYVCYRHIPPTAKIVYQAYAACLGPENLPKSQSH